VTKIDGLLRKCVWAHPMTNKTLLVSFPGFGYGGSLSGMYGLVDSSEDILSAVDSPGTVTFSVLSDGKKVFEDKITHAGYHEFNVALGATPTKLEFLVFANDNSGRHFCFDGWVSD
jgi:hypothetical protein